MPIYEYRCRHCEVEFETLIRGSEEPECPECGTHDLTKLMSAPSAHTASSSLPVCPAAPQMGCGMGGCGGGACPME
jgi:putative FmdB family regulatory protein